MNIKSMISAFLLLQLAACSTGYRCDLGHDCVDSMEAFEHAKTDGGNDESVFVEPEEYPEFKNSNATNSEEDSNDTITMRQMGLGQYKSKPVFIPDSPMRIWIAPEKYESNEGQPIYLVDGYHLFAVIKGGWLLGNKIQRNSISENSSGNFGMIGPLNEKKDLGFKPTMKDKSKNNFASKLFE